MGRTSAADSGARREPEVRRISTDDAFAQRVHLQLEEARASGRQRRLRVSGPPLVVAVLALTCALPLLWLVASLDEEWLSSPIFWSSLLLITAALPLILVSVQPVDTRAVIATSVVSAMWLLIFSSGAALTIMFDFSVWWRLPACGTLDHLYLEFTLEAIGFVVYGAGGCQLMLLLALRCVRGARGIPAPRLLGRTWMTVGVCYVYFALAQLILSAYIFAALSLRRSGALIATVLLNDVHTACWAAFLLTPQSRQRTHAWLAERSDGVSTAAGVAAIIGGSTPQDVIRAGRRRMRAIVPSQLEHIRADSDSAHGRDGSQNAKKKGGVGAAARPPREHIFGKNVPGDNQWYQRTEPADLGGVDAFVSHSWHDEPDDKWAALQQWTRTFQRTHGREPRLWIDRACLDQHAILEELTQLPVYLAGCKQLLILAGGTYQRRLWCVVELFIFVLMGGKAVELVVLPSLGGGESDAAAAELSAFRAERCDCSVPADYERLLGCVEAACGSLPAFDERARALLLSAPKSELRAGGLPPRLQMLAANSGGGGGARRREARWRATLGRPAACCCVLLAVYVCGVVAAVVWFSLPALAACDACDALLARTAVGEQGWHRSPAERGGNLVLFSFSGAGLAGDGVVAHAEAQRECAARGARLASVSTRAENELLECLRRGTATRFPVWIGLLRNPGGDDREAPGAWRWADQKLARPATPGHFSNWARGEPADTRTVNASLREANCGAMDGKATCTATAPVVLIFYLGGIVDYV